MSRFKEKKNIGLTGWGETFFFYSEITKEQS